jgi:glycosyltransferase involved in cell wall biosynthesis
MKISVVTAVKNGDRFLSQCMSSVLSQAGDFSLEYIVCDGVSNDRSLEIIGEFEQKTELLKACKEVVFKWQSQPDNGLYEALS